MITYPLLEAKVGTDEDQGGGDKEPESQDGHQGAEGDGCRAVLIPQDEIEDEEDTEDDAWDEETGREDVGLPALTTKCCKIRN